MANPLAQIIISAVDKTKVAFASVNSGLDKMEAKATAVNGIFARFLPLLGAATVTSFAKNLIDSADAMNDIALRTGIGIERIAAWNLATEQSGTSIEALTSALDKGGRYIVEHGEELKKLGIDAKASEELIFQLADVISSLPADDPKRVAIAMQVLGKSAGELLPLLSLGGDALRRMVKEGGDLAGVMKELGPASDEFNDNLEKMKQNGQIVGAKVLLPLVKRGNEFTTSIRKASDEAGNFGVALKFLQSYMPGLGIIASLLGDDAVATEKAADNTARHAEETKKLTSQLRLLNLQLDDQKKKLAETQRASVQANYKQNIDALKTQIKGFEDLQKAMVDAFTAAGNAANDANLQAQGFFASAERIRQGAQDRLTDIDLRNATPDEQDAVRRQQAQEAMDKSRSARLQAGYQILLGNTEEAQRQLDLAEQQAQRADDFAGRLNDEALARQAIVDSAEALARVEESRAAIQQKIAASETARQESLRQQMTANQANITDLTGRLEALNAKIQELAAADTDIKITTDQAAIDQTLADIATVESKLAALAAGVTVPIRTVDAANAKNFTGVYDADGNAIYRDSGGASGSFAGGGAIFGPGTGTSDSIIARLSRGEHVLTAREVEAAGGQSAIYRLRRLLRSGKLKGFAGGGAVMRAPMPSLSSSPSSSSGMDRGTFVLASGQKVTLHGDSDVFDTLTRASLRLGRRA